MKNNLHSKIDKEKKIVKLMIAKYCKGHKHSDTGALCENCSNLLEYARKRVELCPFMETKTYCSNCKISCYKPDMKVKIKEVMKYSGPRMIFSHPIIVIDHVFQELKYKLKEIIKMEERKDAYDK